MQTISMPRHEAWRLAYRANRYCQHLSQFELNARIRDIFLRILTLTPDAKVGLVSIDAAGTRWMELWTHVLEEMAIRFGPYPAGFTRDILHREPFPDFVGELAKKAASSLEHLRGKNVAIKFGKPEHMQALYTHGAIRVQAASFYRRPDHNGAIRDDELALEVSFHLDRSAIVRLAANPQDVPEGPISQRMDIRFAAKTDYWLYCLTTEVSPRLFVDFEAQACVVIKDLQRFTQAIEHALQSKLGQALFSSGPVRYVDPLLPGSPSIDVPMSKHFRYSHQQEHRFIWVPRTPTQGLTHIDAELGSLSEYAEFISL